MKTRRYIQNHLCFTLLYWIIVFTLNACHEKENPGLEYEIYSAMLEDKLDNYSRDWHIEHMQERIQTLENALSRKQDISKNDDSMIRRMYETFEDEVFVRIESRLKHYQKKLNGQIKSPSSVILVSETEHKIHNKEFTTYNDYLQTMQSFDKYLYTDFIRKNKLSVNIQPIEKLGDKITYLSSDSIDRIFRSLHIPLILLPEAVNDYYNRHAYGWDKFYYTFGNQPILYFSRPGFSKDKTKALIYIEYSESPESGRGFFHILEKQNDKWIIIEDLITSMS